MEDQNQNVVSYPIVLLIGVNLRNANLEGSQMAKVNLRVATLKHGNMKNCDLRGAVLAGADLEVIKKSLHFHKLA